MTDRRLRVAVLVLSLLGAGVAGYLTYVHYADLEAVCFGTGSGCERVQTSDQAMLAGVPVALLGLGAYVVLVATSLARGEAALMLGALTALVGFGFSMYLTREAVVDIGATCQWCLLSTGLMTALAAVTTARLVRDGR